MGEQLKPKGRSTFYSKLAGSGIIFEGSNWDNLDTQGRAGKAARVTAQSCKQVVGREIVWGWHAG